MHRSTICILACIAAPLAAVDGPTPPTGVAIGPELLVGTTAVEIGAVGEIHPSARRDLDIRPELLLNDDGRPGAAIGVLWDVTASTAIPAKQRLEVGPRLAIHNTDDESWELGGLVTWAGSVGPGHHAVEGIGGVGLVHDRRHDDLDLGLTLGIAYLFAP